MAKKKLFKYEIAANKKNKHKLTKAYAKKQAKKQAKKDDEEWKLKVKERDNWTSQIGGKYLKDNPHNCHAHHILDKKNFPQYALDIDNGITLSYREHKVGPKSPHMNAVFFAEWLRINKPKQWEYVKSKIDKII